VVPASRVLPGDGYEDYVKPFRTAEDMHVVGAILAHVLAVGHRNGFPRDLLEETAATLAALRALANERWSDPSVHVALAGVLRSARRILEASDPHWDNVDADVRDRWRRDRGLLSVAEVARGLRTEAAWRKLAAVS
jgi:acyl-CoA dehydrogenase